jgi:predicted permease
MGFHPDRILTLRVPFSEQRYPDSARRNAAVAEITRRMQSIPGVMAAGVNAGLPPVWNWNFPVQPVGVTEPDSRPVFVHQINQDYPKVVGLSLVRGRYLTEQEVHAAVHSAVVNQTFVRRYYAGGDALGRIVRIPRMRTSPFALSDDSFQIVGVVDDTINRAATREVWPEMFLPYTILGRADRFFILANARPEALERALKAQVYSVDSVQPVMDVRTMQTLLSEEAYAEPRFNLLLFSIFAALGLALALFGIYGVISHAVSQQTREIGIRLALGATFSQVIGLMLRTGIRLLAIGIVAGLLASLASVKVLARLVRVSTFDPYTFVGVTLLVFAAGLFASYWPARYAAKVDPVNALRVD